MSGKRGSDRLPCPACSSRELITVKTRDAARGPGRRRRWVTCKTCGGGFSTVETYLGREVKKDPFRQRPLSPSQLIIWNALQERPRTLDELMHEIYGKAAAWRAPGTVREQMLRMRRKGWPVGWDGAQRRYCCTFGAEPQKSHEKTG